MKIALIVGAAVLWAGMAYLRIREANKARFSYNPSKGIAGLAQNMQGTYRHHLAVIVLLKGYPEHNGAMSVTNATIAFQLVKELLEIDLTSYFTIVLSTGITEGTMSEARATLKLLDQTLVQSVDENRRVKILLEEKSISTRTNMIEVRHALRRSGFYGHCVIVTNSESPCGHAQRGYMLRTSLPVIGLIPAQRIAEGYTYKLYYDVFTGIITALGLAILLDPLLFIQIKLMGKRFQYAK